MKVEILFFAQLKDAVGSGSKTIELPDRSTVGDLVKTIRRWPEWETVFSLPLSCAVNETIVPDSHVLADGDRVALLAPISGG